jgi:apolipoprotein N-acyltransferase
MDLNRKHLILTAVAGLVSALAWFFGTGLHPVWWLTWIAPLPVLLVVPRLSRWSALGVAFAAFTIGGLNVWSYDRIVTPFWLTMVILLAPSLVFSFIVLMHRKFILRGQTIRAAFALSVLWSAVEYLSEFRSPHSTWGNLAYAQMDCLPLIQIASITGIWAISFLVFLFPSTIAALIAPVSRKPALAITVAAIYAAVFGYGAYRLHSAPTSRRVTVALIASDATLHPEGPATVALVQAYVDHIPALASQGAKVIVVPEKIGHIKGDDLAQADAILEQAARDNHATILVNFEHQPNLHEARLYSPDGRLEATYEKHHILPAFESHLLPGTARLTFNRPSDDGSEGKWGVEICKDMDFPLLSRQYANDGAGLLLVPAWDFIVDGRLHDRMAILRGVESGFSIARVAKQGLLTLTDDRGRVLAESSSAAQLQNASDPFTTLTGSISVRNEPTIYARTGDWFAWLNLAFAVLFFLPIGRENGQEAVNSSPD